jgi:hypothetical protein
MTTHRTKVSIVAGDPVAGRALEVLLQSSGYGARFLYKLVEEELGDLLADSQVLLIALPLRGEYSRVLQDVMLDPAVSDEIAVLTLLPVNGTEETVQEQGVLSWPCSMGELKRAIEAVLITDR